ncbi:DUF6044 family protein [Caldibacillus lycopersici]|uniref:DUF6044 family protein n=1 Tax=Perspicuibacillus lycopersici TaxID=1325689 RepID=A0AAE3LLY0_9BACI|nr:DUF6044 family protein [Perspicuibacillus lycopersici]MCU9612132.1 DUF6044 family protein [Perspicuibacillus lycopersici]
MIKAKQNKKLLFSIAIIIIGIWVAPYFLFGENAHMRVHDNLDSNIGWYKVLKDSGELFAPGDASIDQILNGELSRDAFYSQFYADVFLFMLFPPMIAYGVSQLITRALAFLGMYLLLKKYVIKDEQASVIQIGVALIFSLTPFWPSGMLSYLGMPLALYAFLNIRNGERLWKNYLILTVLPFLSSFVLGFFYFLTIIGIYWLIEVIRKKKLNLRFFFSILYMIFLYLLIDYRLVLSMLMPHEPTNRDVFYQSKNSLLDTIQLIFKNYIIGHNQDRSVHDLLILPIVLVCFVVLLVTKQWKQNKLFIWLNIWLFVLSVWYAFWFYEGWQPLKEKVNILTTFNFSRFHYFSSPLIYIIFGMALYLIWKLGKWGRALSVLLIIAQFIVLIPYNEQVAYKNQPTYKEFYAVEQFQEIKDYIGKPQEDYRVVSIGIHPVISQYNGFYTLDTYANIYPLTYKEDFRKIIAPELAKNKTLADYYDEWGGRVYIFVDELGKKYMYSKDADVTIENLNLNTDQLKKMGGEYIFSAVPIENALENQLTLEKVFENDSSNWKIYLYKVE